MKKDFRFEKLASNGENYISILPPESLSESIIFDLPSTLEEYREQYIEELKEIQGSWNGKEPGIQEERATTAGEILDLIEHLETI